MPFFNTVPGLVPLKIYSGSTLLTTNVNLINFTGSGVTTTVGAFNNLIVTIGGGGATSFTGSFSGSFTGSLLGTASYATNALSASYALTSSFATSASYAPVTPPFPYTGSAQITGSLGVTGSVSLRSGSNLTVNNGLILSAFNTYNVSVGDTPSWTTTFGSTNVGIGNQTAVTTQFYNTSFGYNALKGGTNNTAIGAFASQYNTGVGNVSLGYGALGGTGVSTSNYQVAIGFGALGSALNTSAGDTNTIAIGKLAMGGYDGGAGNIAVGYQVGYNISSSAAIYNTVLGYNAGLGITTGYSNLAIGYLSLYSVGSGFHNIAIGNQAGGGVGPNAQWNIFMGTNSGGVAGTANNVGYNNIGIGHFALLNLSGSGDYYMSNTAIGYGVMTNSTTAKENVAIGAGAGETALSALRSVIIGGLAGRYMKGAYNTTVGYQSQLTSYSGSYNASLGYEALYMAGATSSGAFNGSGNTAIGANSGKYMSAGINNIFVGNSAGNGRSTNWYISKISSSYNTFIGGGGYRDDADGHCGDYNTGIGWASLGDVTTYGSEVNSPGPRNVGVGPYTLMLMSGSTATRNTALGSNAGSNIGGGGNNTLVGAYAGNNSKTGSYNILIGDSSGTGIISGSNNTIIGSITGLPAGLNNTLIIGVSSSKKIQVDSNNIFVGGLPGFTTGLRNTAIGLSSQGSVTTQTDNTSVGYSALLGGTYNTAVGAYAASLNTGTGNTALGYYALGNQTSDTSYNVAIGYQSMFNSSGSGNLYNVGIGFLTLNNTRGSDNIAIGQRAGVTNNAGSNNVYLGWYAGAYSTTGGTNIAIGYGSGHHILEGNGNILLGQNAGGFNGGAGITMGTGNIGIGTETLYTISSSVGAFPVNIAIGFQAGRGLTTGTGNIAMGYRAGYGIGKGSNNIYIGTDAGGTTPSTLTISSNIGIGGSSLSSNISGSFNTAIGLSALGSTGITSSGANTGTGNTAVGYNAGSILKSGIYNTFIGLDAGANNSGNPVGNGSYNVFMGYRAGMIQGTGGDWGDYGVGIGTYAMGYNGGITPIAPGFGNTALGSYTLTRVSSSITTQNTAVGYRAGIVLLTGERNTLLGSNAGDTLLTGSYNILIGDNAGDGIVSGSNNTIIGTFTGLTASLNDTLIIGTGTTRRIYIDSASVGYINGSIAIGSTTTSSNTENTLSVYPPLAGGTGEGGQILFAASGGLYTSASMIDNYQNQLRILKGTNTGGSTTGYFTMNLDTGASQFLGPVTASAYSGLPNNYLYVTRNTDQTIGVGTWADQDIVFNNSVYSVGIPYAIGSGLASLTGGKVYRITARLAWSAASTYLLQYSCYDSANTQIGPTVEIVQSTNTSNNISDGTLDFIYAPVANIDIKIRTTNNTTALTGEKIRGDLNTQFIIQQIA